MCAVYLVGWLLIAISIITVNNLYLREFLKQVMKQIGETSSLSGEEDFAVFLCSLRGIAWLLPAGLV